MFAEFIENIKIVRYAVFFFMHPLCQSFFSQLTFGLLNPYCNSLVCLAVLILEIIPPKKCVIAFFDPLIRKHVMHAMHRNAVAEMP